MRTNLWGGKIKCQQKRESVRAGSFLVVLGLVEGPPKKTCPTTGWNFWQKIHSPHPSLTPFFVTPGAETDDCRDQEGGESHPPKRSSVAEELGVEGLKVWRSWKCDTKDGVVVSNIFYVHPDPYGFDPISRAYFPIGLKPPTSKDGVVPTMKHSGGNLKHVCFCSV